MKREHNAIATIAIRSSHTVFANVLVVAEGNTFCQVFYEAPRNNLRQSCREAAIFSLSRNPFEKADTMLFSQL